MSVLPMARRALCRDCGRYRLSVGCALLAFWKPRRDTAEATGAAWLRTLTGADTDHIHTLALAAWSYQEGSNPSCVAHQAPEVLDDQR